MAFELPDILLCQTPARWVQMAVEQIDTLLIDHALCEKKAALSAISMLYSYGQYEKILQHMSKLAREELRHFEMVVAIMKRRGISYKPIVPSPYAKTLHRSAMGTDTASRFLGQLVLAAFIEARSYERFVCLSQALPDAALADFYQRLCLSEWRHYQLYLDIAHTYFDAAQVDEAIALLATQEAALINAPDDLYRIHSGVPQ
jgi:tRNA-(ms[2]io[6]A)-hydroxylase